MATTTRKNNMPAFVESTYANLVRAVVDKKFETGIYAYLTDKEMFCYVNAAGSIHIIKGLNWQIQNVTELPDVESGNREVLYIKDGVIYTFDGESYIPSYRNVSNRIDALEIKYDAEFENYYDKDYIDGKLKDLVDPETGETVPVKEYVDTTVKNALAVTKV